MTPHANTTERFVSARRMASPVPACLSVLACVLLFASSPTSAFAKQARLFEGSFGAATSTPANPYPLSNPAGVAVDNASHDVYVTDPGNHRVEKFAPSGEFLLAFGAGVGGPGVDVCGGLVSCTAGTPGSAPGQLTNPIYIAVDDSSGPSKGDVYVADTSDNVVSKFDSSGNLVSGWGKAGQLDGSSVTSPPAPLPGPFEGVHGVAVDASGNLWVAGSALQRPFEFKQDASLITDWQTETAVYTNGIAVDSEDKIYFALEFAVEYDSTGGEVGTINKFGFKPGGIEGVYATSLTVDPSNNDIYIGTYREIVFYESCHPVGSVGYKTCVPTEFFGSGHLSNTVAALAVDPASPTVYAVEEGVGDVVAFSTVTIPDVTTAGVSSAAPTSATLNGKVNPDGVALREGLEGCRFEWGETGAYGHVAPCDKSAAQIGTGLAPVEVHANLTGLVAGKTYHFRLVAGNANDVNEHINEPVEGRDVAFGPPLIDSESALNVSSTSATLEAQVNPQNVDTQVQVEYGTDTGYGHSTPPLDVGSTGVDQSVSEHVQELAPSTVYHYRVVATSVLGTIDGEDRTFTTQTAAGGLALPDGRGWELVSPPDKHGATISSIAFEPASLKSSSSGDSVTYPVTLPTEAGAEGYIPGVQVLSIRGGDGGWSSRDISLPHARAVGLGSEKEYRAFSEDLSSGLVEPAGSFTSLAPNVFPPDSERTPYVRHDMTCVSEPATCFEPLATGAEGYADVPENTKFGGDEKLTRGDVKFVGASPDLTHVILASTVQLTSTVTPAGVQELYEWSADKPAADRLELVSRLENEQPAGKEAGLGYYTLYSQISRNALSSDGSRIVWSEDGGRGGLYLRDVAKGKTLRLDAVKDGTGTGPVGPVFQVASSDGSRVFFIDQQRLTADSGAAVDKPDLYECDIVEIAGQPHCELHDLTPLHGEESANVRGAVIGASQDGSWVYFVANSVLGETGTEGARPGDCQTDEGVSCNLYVMHDGEAGWESPRLVAVLSGEEDYSDWTGHDPAALMKLTARVSPDGGWLAFMSARSLTGYDNRDAVSGKPDKEVFLYHANTGGAGGLVCASCDPSGARPAGVEYATVATDVGLVAGGGGTWRFGEWLAASLPVWTPYASGKALYQSRYLSDEGRLFFNSSDALVPQDINHNQDVYEFEPAGVGGASGCTTGSSTYSAATGGCTSLISSGRATGESAFIDASETGGDVFFLTGEKLVGKDVDTSLDLYDAHACTTASPCASETAIPPACTTADACRTAPEPQPAIFGSPASATFSGTGNVTAPGPPAAVKPKILTRAQKLAAALRTCHRKSNKRKRAVCERQAHKVYGAKRARTGGVIKRGKG